MTENAIDKSVLAINSSIVTVMKRACPSAIDLSSSKMTLRIKTKDEKKMKHCGSSVRFPVKIQENTLMRNKLHKRMVKGNGTKVLSKG